MNDFLYSKWLKILVARSETVSGIEIPYLDPSEPKVSAILAGAEKIDATSRRAAFEYLARAPHLNIPADMLPLIAQVAADTGKLNSDIAVHVVNAASELSEEITPAQFREWSASVVKVTEELPRAAVAVLRCSRHFYQFPRRVTLDNWIAGGRRTWQLGWQTYGMLEMILDGAAEAASFLPDRSFQFWCETASRLAFRAGSLAQDFCGEPLDTKLPETIQSARLELLAAVATHHPEKFMEYRRLTADCIRRLSGKFRVIAPILAQLVLTSSEGCASVMRKMLATADDSDLAGPGDQRYEQVAAAARRIMQVSPQAALGLLESMAEVLRLVGPDEFTQWVEDGERLLAGSPVRAEAHFKLSSKSARASLEAYVQGVRFEEITRSLRLYAQGLTGREIPLVPLDWQKGKLLPTTDGEKIYLPALVFEHGSRDANRRVFRVMCAHQCGFFEFGTFEFQLQKMAKLRSWIIKVTDYSKGGPIGGSDLDKFFVQFPRMQLAKDLFLLLENYRIDEAIIANYPGLRDDIGWLRTTELARRSLTGGVGERRFTPVGALVELAVHLSLGRETLVAEGETDETMTPERMEIEEQFQNLRAMFVELKRPDTTVEHSAVKTAEIYRLFSMLLDTRVSQQIEDELAEGEEATGEMTEEAGEAGEPDPDQPMANAPPRSGKGPDRKAPDFDGDYDKAEPVRFHGELNPEEIQRRFQADGAIDIVKRLMGTIEMMKPEEIASWLGDDELSFLPMGPDEEAGGQGLFASMFDMDRVKQTAREHPDQIPELLQEFQQEIKRMARLDTLDERYDDAFRYDEWDHKLSDYRHAWCTVREKTVDNENTEFVDRALAENAGLISKVIRQFEAIRPELLKKEYRLPDGEEIDLNTVVEAIADKRQGLPMPERIYTQRRKQEREVAALFLIDMSASTGEKVPDDEQPPAPTMAASAAAPKPDSKEATTGLWSDPRFGNLPASPVQEGAFAAKKTVLDLQKEALVVMSQALNYLGDDYAIYGFSGYGRDRVDVYKVKEFGEAYSEKVKGKIGGIKPQQSTRMGAAIRHSIEKLRGMEARYRTLIMLSDGYPQDSDYGEDRTDENYSLLDTRLALEEATRAGVHTFCITVDKAGYDYLKQMCPEDAYLVIDRIRDLPVVLPRVYRSITR